MAEPKQSPFRRTLNVVAEIVVALYLAAEALISLIFRPFMQWLSSLRLIKRIESWIVALPAYVILVILVVPFIIAELTKVLGVYLMASGHFHFGMTIFIGAYVVSVLVCERILHAGKPKLMTLGWFAVGYNWVMAIKDHVLAWLRNTRVWRLFGEWRERIRSGFLRGRERLRVFFGRKPKESLEHR